MGTSRAAILAASFGLLMAPATQAANFNVPNGATDSTPKTVSGTDVGTIGTGATLQSTAGTAITWNNASTGLVITNSGTIQSTATGQRAINASGGDNTRSILLTNNAGALIASPDDAFRINVNPTGGTITVNNAGTIRSQSGQALDFDAAASGAATIVINNLAGGVIQSNGQDAIRPGQGATVNNAGTIFSTGAAGNSYDGIDFQAKTGTVNNQAGGVISGLRHGITTDTGVVVNNAAGATITGRNGSGVGSDGTGTVINFGTITGAYDGSGRGDGDGVDIDFAATIVNHGTIQGTGAGGFDSGNRANNSEGISIGGGSIRNDGTISGATYAIVVNNDSNADNSRSGVAATTIINDVGGQIVGQGGYAIRLENKTGTAADADTIVNYGTIIGNGAIPDPDAIILRGDNTADPGSVGTLNGITYTGTGAARFIRGDGAAIQMGEGNDVLTNYGTVVGNNGRAISLEGGNDILNIATGSTVTGRIDGGVGTDTVNLIGTGTGTLANVINVEVLNVRGGRWSILDDQAYSSGVTIASGALLQVGNGATSGSLAANVVNDGTLAFNRTDGLTFAGTISGSGSVQQAGSGTTTLTGTNTYTGTTAITAGTLRAGAANAFSSASAVTIADAGRMDLNGFAQTVASLAGSGSVTLGSATLTTGGSNATTTYAGTISGTGGLIKTGTGGFTLSGANGFTGSTRVQASTLAVASGGSLAGSVNNAAGFTNAGSVAGSLTNSGTATNSGTIGGGLTNTGTVAASAGRIDGAIANNAGTITVSGQVASNGSFANAGGATLAVAGTGAYGLAGLLTNAGSLTVASGGSLTAPAGINNSGSIAVAQGGTITDALANTGSVVNDGAYNADVGNGASGSIANRATGVWTGNLTANTGGVTNAGQWNGDGRNDAGGSVTNTGSWTTATGPFANAGTLATSGVLNGGVANTGSVQASGQIVGAVSNGAGARFALTGPLGGVTTFANDGTLDLGGTAFTVGSLSGTNAGATLRNGALTTGGDNGSTAYAGTIVDGAAATSLTKNGTGSLTLTGTNTYTGGTTVNAGRLVASVASLGSGPVTSNSDLILDQAADATLGSAINGTGRVTKQGAGTLTYTGTGSLSGSTTVATGGLVVAGSLAASPVTVANGAAVGGTGRIGALTVQSGARVAPGAGTAAGSLGTLNVNGNVLFAAQSIYQVDANAGGQSDRIAATGAATLQGGTVQVTAGTGAYAPRTRYTILSAAGGVTGQFAGVTSNFAFLTPFLTYDANDAYLTLARNDLQFGTVATTRNQGNTAAAAQAQGVGTSLYDGIAVLSASQARQAFDGLSGEIHSSAVTSQFATGYLVREAILDRLRFGETPSFGGLGAEGIGQRFAPGTTLPAVYTADLPGRTTAPVPVSTQLVAPTPVAVWGQGSGSFGSIGGDGNAARLDQQTSGFLLGADTRLGDSWRVGVAGGYTFTTLDVTARQSTGTVESGYGALYAGSNVGPVQLRLGGVYAGSSLVTNRAVLFPGFSENASARYGGSLGQAFGEVGYRIGSGTGYVEPFVGGAAIRIGRDGFTERGGAAALTSRDHDYDIATSTVGVQAQGQIGDFFGSTAPVFVRGLVGYRRAYGDVVPSTLFSLGAAGQTFLTAGVPIARDAMVAQAGLDWQVAPATTLSVAYTGQVGADRTQIHGIKGGFHYRW